MFKKVLLAGALCALALFCGVQSSNASTTQFAEFTTKDFHITDVSQLLNITGSFAGNSDSNFQYDMQNGHTPAAPGNYIAGTFSLTANIGAFDNNGQASASNIFFNILDSQNKNLLSITGSGLLKDSRSSENEGTVSLIAQNTDGTKGYMADTLSYASSFIQFGTQQAANYTLDLSVSTHGTATGEFSSDSIQPVPEPMFIQLGTLLICTGGLAAFRLRRA
jgi:hypothetical protein